MDVQAWTLVLSAVAAIGGLFAIPAFFVARGAAKRSTEINDTIWAMQFGRDDITVTHVGTHAAIAVRVALTVDETTLVANADCVDAGEPLPLPNDEHSRLLQQREIQDAEYDIESMAFDESDRFAIRPQNLPIGGVRGIAIRAVIAWTSPSGIPRR